jgi:hypothetical protein
VHGADENPLLIRFSVHDLFGGLVMRLLAGMTTGTFGWLTAMPHSVGAHLLLSHWFHRIPACFDA